MESHGQSKAGRQPQDREDGEIDRLRPQPGQGGDRYNRAERRQYIEEEEMPPLDAMERRAGKNGTLRTGPTRPARCRFRDFSASVHCSGRHCMPGKARILPRSFVLAKGFPPVDAAFPDDVTPQSLTRFCVAFVADMLDRAPGDIDPQATFSRIGFDSAMAVQLIVELEDRLDLELLPDLVAEYPTIARLSEHLCALSQSPSAGA